jgi:hypothetical protein
MAVTTVREELKIISINTKKGLVIVRRNGVLAYYHMVGKMGKVEISARSHDRRGHVINFRLGAFRDGWFYRCDGEEISLS